MKRTLSLLSAPFLAAFVLTAGISSPAHAADQWFFASDVHELGASQLGPILQQEVLNSSYNVVSLLGDYQYGITSDVTSYNQILNLVNTNKPASAISILVQGNHDRQCSSNCYTHATGAVATPTQNSAAFVINEQDFCTPDIANVVGNFILGYWEGVSVILAHYPLHSTRLTGQCKTAAINLFNQIQAMSTFARRDVVYLWGHNHSSSSYDSGMDYTLLPNDTMPSGSNVYTEVAGATMHFTYLNAGYIKGVSGAAASWTKLLVDANQISIDRHSNPNEYLTVQRDYN